MRCSSAAALCLKSAWKPNSVRCGDCWREHYLLTTLFTGHQVPKPSTAAVRDPMRGASARALLASGNLGRCRTQPRESKRQGRRATRGDACAFLRVWRGGCAHSYEISSPFDVRGTPRKWTKSRRRLDVASSVANDRVQHALRATHTRCRAHTERRPTRAHFALAPRRAGRHFGGGCAAEGRR